ncbi:UNVERIFIED_CONTAM: Ubiquitin carboxyl-terminal hydrolase 12 [Gekko kuhli]
MKELRLALDWSEKMWPLDSSSIDQDRQGHGANASALEKEIGPEQFPVNEHYFGLVNFGNTCYCNSVLQALYFCRPFREKVLAYKVQPRKKESLLTCLSDLFNSIATQKKKVGVIPPKKFISRLRKENELFDNYMQQDAHEFLNYLLNTIADLLQEEKKQEQQNGKLQNGSIDSDEGEKDDLTWVHEIFQGTLTNETRCLNCEAVSSKDEDFLDLSVDVEQNTSITHCLRGFSNTETLCSEYKYYCEQCRSKQEAQKSIDPFSSKVGLNRRRFGTTDRSSLEPPPKKLKLKSKHKTLRSGSADPKTHRELKISGPNKTVLKTVMATGEQNSAYPIAPLSLSTKVPVDMRSPAVSGSADLPQETFCLSCSMGSFGSTAMICVLPFSTVPSGMVRTMYGSDGPADGMATNTSILDQLIKTDDLLFRRMRVKKLPMILALHLKRFKYMDQLHRYTKLSYRVVFPLELRLFNTSGDATNPDRMYDLVAVVVHCGSGPNRGHYITIVKSHGFWLLFDDDIVEKIDAQAIEEFYGLTSDISKNSESGYILFYQSRD